MTQQDHLESLDDDDSIQLKMSGCTIELMHDGGDWPADLAPLGELIANAVEISLDAAQSEKSATQYIANLKSNPHINILLSSDDHIRRLNLEFRNIDKPTNVLSFPVGDDSAFGPEEDAMIGDIVLGHQTVAAEAKEQKKSFNDHTIHLVVHGVLHLLGFDHQGDNEATNMEELETRILSMMNISNPYASVFPIDQANRTSSGGK